MRKRSKPHSFEQRLAEHRSRLEAEAARLPHGSDRDAVMKRIEQLQTAADMNKWLSQSNWPDGQTLMKLDRAASETELRSVSRLPGDRDQTDSI
jgi:hypothetical protein